MNRVDTFDPKKQLFYCVFGLMCGCLVSIVLTLHNNGMIEYRRITLYQISQIHHLSRAKDLLLEYWKYRRHTISRYPFWPIQD